MDSSDPQKTLSRLIQIRKHFDQVDINIILSHAEQAAQLANNVLEERDGEKAIRWAKVADYALQSAAEKNRSNHQEFLHNRILLRLHIISRIGENHDDDITNLTVIIDWLSKELSHYDFREVEALVTNARQQPGLITAQQLLSLRRLRYWVVVLNRIKGINSAYLTSELAIWEEFTGKLP